MVLLLNVGIRGVHGVCLQRQRQALMCRVNGDWRLLHRRLWMLSANEGRGLLDGQVLVGGVCVPYRLWLWWGACGVGAHNRLLHRA